MGSHPAKRRIRLRASPGTMPEPAMHAGPGLVTPCRRLTIRQSASLDGHGEVKRGETNAAPQAPLHRGGEALADRPEFFTFCIKQAWRGWHSAGE